MRNCSTVTAAAARVTGAGLLAACILLTGCGKSETASQARRGELTVAAEAGPLPAAGQANRLLKEQSSFLRRHAQDPVDWYPWGGEAFDKARAENKPVLLVIGYASCPWTERMTLDSYSDPVIARFMNRYFINVLVDREERPDVNSAFLNFFFSETGQSGWPLHTWLTPSGLPMFSGVYFPKVSEGGKPSWELTLSHRAMIWDRQSEWEIKAATDKVEKYADKYLARINQSRPELDALGRPTGAKKLTEELKPEVIRRCFTAIAAVYDPVSGGFTRQPKFPAAFIMEFLLRYAAVHRSDRYGSQYEALRMVDESLLNMCRGALRDHLGGGFHRYSRDIYWATPQFEKMLYDQGYLTQLLLHAGAATGRAEFLSWAEETLQYADRDLSHPEGAFYCADGSISPRTGKPTPNSGAEMAQSDGAYYLWTREEIEKALTPEQIPVVTRVWGLADSGNIPVDSPSWKDYQKLHSIREVNPPSEAARALQMPEAEVQKILTEAGTRLLTARNQRPRPLRDDKVIASWNGTMISAFAKASWALGKDPLRKRAESAAQFILTKLRDAKTGELIHSYLDSGSNAPGYSEDYALTVGALLDLYEATGTIRWLDAASELMEKHIELLYDDVTGLFFDGPNQALLFHRFRSFDETSELSPSSTALINLMRLHYLRPREMKTGPDYVSLADKAFKEIGPVAAQAPTGHIRMVLAWDMRRLPALQIVIDGPPDAPETRALVDAVRTFPRPNSVIIHLNSPEARTHLAERAPQLGALKSADGKPAIHFCREFKLIRSVSAPADAATFMSGEFTVVKEP